MNRRIGAEKNNDKDGKALYKLMNNAIYRNTMENLRNRNNEKEKDNEKQRKQWKRPFKMNTKTKLNVAQNIWQ